MTTQRFKLDSGTPTVMFGEDPARVQVRIVNEGPASAHVTVGEDTDILLSPGDSRLTTEGFTGLIQGWLAGGDHAVIRIEPVQFVPAAA